MAKAPATPADTAAPTDPLVGLAQRVDAAVAAVAALTGRVDDLAGLVAGFPDRKGFETLSMALTKAMDNNTELTATNERLQLQVSDLVGDLQRLRQDIVDLKSGGVGFHLVGDAGPTLDAELIGHIRGAVLGVDFAQVNYAEAAEAVGITVEEVFSAKRRVDGTIGVVTTDGRKLIEGQV